MQIPSLRSFLSYLGVALSGVLIFGYIRDPDAFVNMFLGPEYISNQPLPSGSLVGRSLYSLDTLDIFSYDGKNYNPVSKFPKGTRLTIVDDRRLDSFVWVITPDDWIGLVNRNYLTGAPIGPQAPAIIPAPPQAKGPEDARLQALGSPESRLTTRNTLSINADEPCFSNFLPKNGQVVFRRGFGDHKITVDNRDPGITLVRLRDSKQKRRISDAISFFIVGTGSTTIDRIPEGTYQVLFITSDKWELPCGDRIPISAARPSTQKDGFAFSTPDAYVTRREKDGVVFSHWTYTIQPVINGNASTSAVSLAEFFQ